MAKPAKRTARPPHMTSRRDAEREQTRRALRRAHQREKDIVQLTKRVERATAAADRALAELGMLILDRDAKRSDARADNETMHAGVR